MASTRRPDETLWSFWIDDTTDPFQWINRTQGLGWLCDAAGFTPIEAWCRALLAGDVPSGLLNEAAAAGLKLDIVAIDIASQDASDPTTAGRPITRDCDLLSVPIWKEQVEI